MLSTFYVLEILSCKDYHFSASLCGRIIFEIVEDQMQTSYGALMGTHTKCIFQCYKLDREQVRTRIF